jgi:hypothetical protein
MSIVQASVLRGPSRLLVSRAIRETGIRPRMRRSILPDRIFAPESSTRRSALAPHRRILHFLLYTEITLAELHSILTSNKQSQSRVCKGK